MSQKFNRCKVTPKKESDTIGNYIQSPGAGNERSHESRVGRIQENIWLKNNPGKTPKDFKTLWDKVEVVSTPDMVTHPPIDERIEHLEIQRQQDLPDARKKPIPQQSR